MVNTKLDAVKAMLSGLSTDELQALIQIIKKEYLKESEFYFDSSNNASYGVPSASKVYWNSEKCRVEYEPIELEREYYYNQYGYKFVGVYGSYTAYEGEVIYEYHPDAPEFGAYTQVCVAYNGELWRVSDKINDRVIAYLKGEISLDKLLQNEP